MARYIKINPASKTVTFKGFRRADGQVGIRNQIWIIPTVGCVNGAAQAIASRLNAEKAGKMGNVDAIVAFPHNYGGSDGLSGITTNPLLGVFSDWIVSQGGTTVLTEVPEMFGAETILMNRCQDSGTFDKTVSGKSVKNEEHGIREIAIFKTGVTL